MLFKLKYFKNGAAIYTLENRQIRASRVCKSIKITYNDAFIYVDLYPLSPGG